MPFISEELYQKLPNFNGKIESICIAPYPQANGWRLDSERLKDDFEVVYNVVKTIRSIAANINLPNNAKAPVLIIPLKNADALKDNEKLISTLSKSGDVKFVADQTQIPKGCVMDVSPNGSEIYLYVKDLIDIKKEIERLEKKLNNNKELYDALNKKVSVPDYESKVPENVKKQNKEKLDNYINENKKLGESLENLKKLL